VAVHYEQKQAVLRYEAGKVRLEDVLARYGSTRFAVSPAGPVTAFVRQDKATVKAWADPARLTGPSAEATLFVELLPAEGARLAGPAVSSPRPPPGFKLVKDVEEEPKSATRRYRFRIGREGPSKGGELAVPVQFKYTLDDRPAGGEIGVPLLVEESGERLPSGGVALVGGALELGLAHLCDQKGCVDHFHKSLQGLGGLAGVRPKPGLKEPGATLYVRSGEPIDLWTLRQKLRDQGIEVRRLAARDLGPLSLRVELRRWKKEGEESQCLACLERSVQAVRAVPWASQAGAAEGGIRVRVGEGEPDLAALLDALEGKGVAPVSLWLVPDRASAPAPAPAATVRPPSEPKRGGSEAHPLIQLDLDHECPGGAPLLDLLGRQAWTSRTARHPDRPGTAAPVLPAATFTAGVADRQQADLASLLRDLRAAGRQPDRIRLSGFGQVRLQFEFAHLCGEVEYSKPPDPKKQAEGEKKEPVPSRVEGPQAGKEPPKPFVPQPLRPAPSSNARKAIEKALAAVGWIKEGTYLEYHTRPEFTGPRRLLVSLVPAREDLVRPDEIVRLLREAGFPPVAVRVSRTFPGLEFGEKLPGDLELASREGGTRLLSSFRRDGRPLAVAFVSLNCPKWDKYKYAADPRFYRKLKETVDACAERVDFVAVSSNPDDPFEGTAEFWERVGVRAPLLHDPRGSVRAVLNAQITPPPHWFVFDGDGRLRYAGDGHDNWEKPEAAQKDYLREALDLVQAGKVSANGAVFFNTPKCNCSHPKCSCPKCGCGASCRCAIKHCKVGF
jgi:hypothetical protein